MSISVQEINITPALASSWLARNKRNRPLRSGLVNTYASDIAAGKWQQNGETIKQAASGDLLDGQHRLHAIIKAAVPVRMMVVSGLADDTFHTIDTGMKRSAAQLVALSGRHNAAIQAAVARWLVMLDNHKPRVMAKSQTTSQEIFDALERYPLIPHFSARQTEKGTRSLLPSASQAVMVLAAEKYSQLIPDSFLDAFSSGEGLKKGDPVFELRERLIQNSARVAKLTTQTIVAITIKSLKAYATQRMVGVLRWSPNEEWPEL